MFVILIGTSTTLQIIKSLLERIKGFMEFFVWCWIWDRRLLCGLRRRALFIYLWFIPAVISFCVLPYSGIRYMDDMQNPKECDRISEVNEERQNLFLGVHLMQAMIVLTFLTSLGMIV